MEQKIGVVVNEIEKHLEARGLVFSVPVRGKNEYSSGGNFVAGKNFHLKIEERFPSGYRVTIAKNGKHGFIVELYWNTLKEILDSAESLAILCCA